MTPRTAEYMTRVRPARVSWARMKWASIWLRSLSTFSRNSRCGRDWMVESRKSLKARPSFRKKMDNSGTTKNSQACLATSATRNPTRCASCCDFVAVADQERLRPVRCTSGSSRGLVPSCVAMLPELSWVSRVGQGLSQPRALPRHLGAHRPQRTPPPARAAGRRSRRWPARVRAALFPGGSPAGSSGRRRRWRTETRSEWRGPRRESPAPARTAAL